jgi:hypothetical protein
VLGVEMPSDIVEQRFHVAGVDGVPDHERIVQVFVYYVNQQL